MGNQYCTHVYEESTAVDGKIVSVMSNCKHRTLNAFLKMILKLAFCSLPLHVCLPTLSDLELI